ncbi:MAG TPA: redoxin domain-containing protein [Myxococcota bacterium]|nr:redoxin domain-containing protein [Myxococcota bacterium]
MNATLRAMVAPLALGFAVGALPAAAARPSPPRDAPEIHADAWINGEPGTMADLRGRVVLVEFFTFACGNCQNVEPHLKRWHARYADQGLVTVAVHTPELAFERDVAKLRAYVTEHGIEYPVAVDGGYTTWRRFRNWAWPTIYLVGKQGRIRHVRVGEGGYDETEATIRALLAEP